MPASSIKQKKQKKRRPGTCKHTTNGSCKKGRYKLHYENNAPVFVCNECEDKELTWHKFYTEYLQLYKKKENWDIDKHKVTCIIGFFCHMYKDFYDIDYIFVPQNPNPYGCKECKDAWKLLATFKNDSGETRRYIHWVFKKLIRKNTNIVSFGYINSPGIIRKYNLYSLKKKSITRSSKLPGTFIEWCTHNVPTIFDNYELTTMNDLGALLSVVRFYKTNELTIERVAIEAAEKLNLIKNGKLNI